MAFVPSLPVFLDCLSVYGGGGGSGRVYDCSVLSCAWKAPRVLTGSLASTASAATSLSSSSPRLTGRRISRCFRDTSGNTEVGGIHCSDALCFIGSGSLLKTWLLCIAHKTRKWKCSASLASQSFSDVSSESLWEVAT